MGAPYIWHKLHLHNGKVVALSMVMMAMSLSGFAQKRDHKEKVINLPHYDERFFHYGFTIAANGAAYNINQSDYFLQNTDSVQAVNGDRTVGFTIGFVVNLHLNDNFDLRVLPNVGFYQRDVTYDFRTRGETTQEIESNVLELPILLKFKSRREGNFRVYAVGGIKPGLEVSSNQKKTTGEDNLRIKDNDFCIEYGFGLDIYNPMFKFSPEIRFSHGLNNMLVNDPNIYARSLDRLNTHTVTLYFHFE